MGKLWQASQFDRWTMKHCLTILMRIQPFLMKKNNFSRMSLQKASKTSSPTPLDTTEGMKQSPRMSPYLIIAYQSCSFPSLMALTPIYGLTTTQTTSTSTPFQKS
jgi:hypothetical protein